MDDLDRRIIAALQVDGTTTNVAIARDIDVSEETVRRRTIRLIRDQTIKIAGIPNSAKMGIDSQALIGLQVDADRLDAVAETLAEFAEITWVAITTGSIDVMAWVNLRSANKLRYLISRQVSRIPGVQRVETFVCMENMKEQYGVMA
jgi:Lrp/AsnC family transcriptional regulator for asnA, asnC and gidA